MLLYLSAKLLVQELGQQPGIPSVDGRNENPQEQEARTEELGQEPEGQESQADTRVVGAVHVVVGHLGPLQRTALYGEQT